MLLMEDKFIVVGVRKLAHHNLGKDDRKGEDIRSVIVFGVHRIKDLGGEPLPCPQEVSQVGCGSLGKAKVAQLRNW